MGILKRIFGITNQIRTIKRAPVVHNSRAYRKTEHKKVIDKKIALQERRAKKEKERHK